MRRRLFWIYTLGWLAFPSALPARAREPSALEVAGRLQKFYDSTTDFQAAFQQEYESRALSKKSVSSGYVYVKKPGKMRWDYLAPHPKHFVADGKSLYIYDPELEQVILDRDFASSDLTVALTFLWGKGKLTDEFAIAFGKLPPPSAAQVVIELTPRKAARFKRLLFVVDKATFRVDGTLVEDPGGNTNRITFSKISVNRGLKDAAFKLDIPKGVEVIEVPRDGKVP